MSADLEYEIYIKGIPTEPLYFSVYLDRLTVGGFANYIEIIGEGHDLLGDLTGIQAPAIYLRAVVLQYEMVL